MKPLKVKLAGTESSGVEWGGKFLNYSWSDAAAFFGIPIPQFVKAAEMTFDFSFMGTDIR